MSRKGGSSTQHSSFGLGTATAWGAPGVVRSRDFPRHRCTRPTSATTPLRRIHCAASWRSCELAECVGRISFIHCFPLLFLHPPRTWFVRIMHDSAYIGSLIPHCPCYATAIHPSIISHVSPLPRSLEPRCHLLYTFPQHVLHNFHYNARHGMNRCVFRRHLGLCLVFNCLS